MNPTHKMVSPTTNIMASLTKCDECKRKKLCLPTGYANGVFWFCDECYKNRTNKK